MAKGGGPTGGMLNPRVGVVGGVALLFRSLFSLFCRFLTRPLGGVAPELDVGVVLFANTKGGTTGEALCAGRGLLGPLLAGSGSGEDNVLVGVAFISGCITR
jgi:hypothetical protein